MISYILRRTTRTLTLILFFAAISCAAEPLRYELAFERPNTHLMDVTIHAGGLDGKAVQFSMPVWSPGGYFIQNLAANVQGFRATDPAGRSLLWHKTDSHTWQIDLSGSTGAIVHYQVYANGSGFSIQYDERHVALTGPATWMYQVDGKDRPVALRIDTSPLPSNWKIATGMEKTGTATFQADDYDWFADCPIEISDFAEKDIAVLGTTYHFIVHDELGKQDFTAFTRDMQQILEKGLVPILAPAVGGRLAAPFADYWFLIHMAPGLGLGGGVEHLNSTKISFSRDWDDHSPTTHDYLTNVYDHKIFVAVHELFHAWNVKRLRPRPLGPFDYTQMVHTPSLWISEGLTSYFTAVAMLRSSYWSPQDYLAHIGRLITAFDQMPGRRERSIAETSWDTWFGFSGRGALEAEPNLSSNLVNTNYSYYDGGQILGVLLDLEIRHRTQNRKSLDDWMGLMYQRFALPKRGFEQSDVVRAASEVAGTDMSEFFDRYLFGKDPLPYERDFAFAGIQAQKTFSAQPWLGAVLVTSREGRTLIGNIIPGSPAEKDGLDRGDIIVAVDQKALDRAGIEKELAAGHPGERPVFTVVRRGELRQFPVTLGANPYASYSLKHMENASELQKEIYRSVLNVK